MKFLVGTGCMSDLPNAEKRKFERLLGMSGGSVLNFSNRTFSDFVFESTRREINDSCYGQGSGSKANRLRTFWNDERNGTGLIRELGQYQGNHVVSMLTGDMLNYYADRPAFENNEPLLDDCLRIVSRLTQNTPVPELD